MNALVSGGAGFIGSAIARRLVEEGARVRVLDNLFAGSKESVPDGADFCEGDVRDPQVVAAALEDVDTVFHLAAIRSVPMSVEEPKLTHETNAGGTLNMLEASVTAGVSRFIYSSTSAAYGDPRQEVQSEDLVPEPRSPYGATKVAGELYCRVFSDQLHTVSLRYFNVFGPGQNPESKYSAVFPGFIAALRSGRAPEVHWDGEQSRDFVFIDDVVAANLAAANSPDVPSGAVINIGTGTAISVNEVLRTISGVLGTWIDPVHLPMRAGDVRRTTADILRARTFLAWTPQTTWEEAVKRTVDWFSSS